MHKFHVKNRDNISKVEQINIINVFRLIKLTKKIFIFLVLLAIFTFLLLFGISKNVYSNDKKNNNKNEHTISKEEKIELNDNNPNRYEYAFIPIAGGNNDLGVFIALLPMLVKFDEKYEPYRWKGMLALAGSGRNGDDGFESPYKMITAAFDFPQIFAKWYRLKFSFGFSENSSVGYYGIGNDSENLKEDEKPSKYNEFKTKSPFL